MSAIEEDVNSTEWSINSLWFFLQIKSRSMLFLTLRNKFSMIIDWDQIFHFLINIEFNELSQNDLALSGKTFIICSSGQSNETGINIIIISICPVEWIFLSLLTLTRTHLRIPHAYRSFGKSPTLKQHFILRETRKGPENVVA